MATTKKSDWKKMMEEWFMKLPPLPKGGREGLVSLMPWLALIFGILGVWFGISGLGILTAFSPLLAMGGGWGVAGGSLVAAALGVVASVMMLFAFPSLKVKKMAGWNLLFWSEVISVIGAVVAFSLQGVLFSAIGFYLLFQIKSYYK